MWLQFFLENTHFALSLLVALVFFATGWLYFDAWLGRKTLRDGLKVFGFALLSISFLIHATYIESSLITSSIFGNIPNSFLVILTRIPGYVLLIAGLLIDPLQAHPLKKEGIKQTAKEALILPFAGLPVIKFVPLIFPVLAVLTGFLYLRRSTVGLESHLKAVAFSFYFFAFFELVSLHELLTQTSNVDLYKLVAPFAPFWILQHLLLFTAILILGRWLYFYLLKRLQSQIFMILTFSILVIFLLITTTFTGLLLKNLEDETLKNLETDVKVLNFAVEAKKGEGLSDVNLLSQNPVIRKALEEGDKKTLSDNAENFLLNKKQATVVIVSDSGQVLARGEDKERTGDSLADDPLIKRAMLGEAASSMITRDGVLGPEVGVRSAAPLKAGETILGVIMTGVTLDNAFVDGVKAATGLEAAIYGDNILSATTLLAADGKSRYIGVREEGESVKGKVLGKGENYTGSVNLLNTPYFASYSPLKDVDGNPLGMLFVGKRQIGVLQTAGRSIELTFVVAAVLLVLSVVPAYLISKYLTNQLK